MAEQKSTDVRADLAVRLFKAQGMVEGLRAMCMAAQGGGTVQFAHGAMLAEALHEHLEAASDLVDGIGNSPRRAART